MIISRMDGQLFYWHSFKHGKKRSHVRFEPLPKAMNKGFKHLVPEGGFVDLEFRVRRRVKASAP